MKSLKVVMFFMLCVMMSGCQQNEINELKKELAEQEQKISEQEQIISEFNTLIENLENEKEELNQYIDNFDNSKHEIEKDFEKEMKTWSGVTSEGVEITMKYSDKWKSEMEKYYDLLHDELDEDKRKWLISSQTKWNEFSAANIDYLWHVNDQIHQGGSIIRIINAHNYYERYRNRALFLIKEYDDLISLTSITQ